MEIGKWCPGIEFDAYPMRQFMIETTNIEILAEHQIWSTIITLPATLLEPSPWTKDRGHWSRYLFRLDFMKEVGAQIVSASPQIVDLG